MFADIKREILAVYKYRYVVYSYVHTNLKLRYRRSTLGFLWTVIAPMLNYLVIGIVFNFIMRNQMENFFPYYFSGAVFFAIISSCLNRSTYTLIGNEHYIKKIYVPKLIFVLNGTLYEFVNFTLSAVSLIILGVITGYLQLSSYFLLTFIPLFLLCFFLIGLGSIIGIATVYFRDLLHIIPVAIQALFFLTPVIYERSIIPERYQFLVTLNPFFYFLESYRQPLVFHQIPPTSYYLVCVTLSIVSLVAGMLLIKKFDNRIVFKL